MIAQIIDDTTGNSIVQISSNSEAVKAKAGSEATKTDISTAVGQLIAAAALEKGVKTVVFDRGGYVYHGRVKAVAEAARTAGLEF